MTNREPTVLRIGAEEHDLLRELKNEGPFAEMLHAYRFAIAYALARGGEMVDFADGTNVFNVGSVEDVHRSLYHAVRELRPDSEEPVYRTAEKLATWGVREIHGRLRSGDISFISLLDELAEVDESSRDA